MPHITLLARIMPKKIGPVFLLLVIPRGILGYQWRTFVPPMMFSNSGNMGLPLTLFAFGEQALPAAVMLFIVENSLHFTLGMKVIHSKASFVAIFRIPMLLDYRRLAGETV